jgi:hypothetical protein
MYDQFINNDLFTYSIISAFSLAACISVPITVILTALVTSIVSSLVIYYCCWLKISKGSNSTGPYDTHGGGVELRDSIINTIYGQVKADRPHESPIYETINM